MLLTHPPGKVAWQSERERIDLAAVATSLLGLPPGRRGERGRKLWWNCPFHDDANPSFSVEPGKLAWRCWGCGAHGDAANLLMRLERLTFPESVRRLTGGDLGPTSYHSTPRPARPPTSDGPKGLPISEAMSLVDEATTRLWAPEGAEALAHLVNERHLRYETIRLARLGCVPRVELPTQDGKLFTARGIVIPWFDGDRLTKVNIRQSDGSIPKYAQAFQDRPTTYKGTPSLPKPGIPLVVVEGEFDALLLGQELAGLAVVVSLGSASISPHLETLDWLGRYNPWHTAHDADPAGDGAAAKWPMRSRRVRPPIGKDWVEAARAGINLRRWWTDKLKGKLDPDLFTWTELSTWRWGPSVSDPEPGVVITKGSN